MVFVGFLAVIYGKCLAHSKHSICINFLLSSFSIIWDFLFFLKCIIPVHYLLRLRLQDKQHETLRLWLLWKPQVLACAQYSKPSLQSNNLKFEY